MLYLNSTFQNAFSSFSSATNHFRNFILVALFLFLGISYSQAGTKTWANPGTGGAWATAGNWSEGSAPTTGDDVVINPSATITITGVPAVTSGIRTLTIGGTGDVTLSLNSGITLSINGPTTSNNLVVGAGATLQITGNTSAGTLNFVTTTNQRGSISGTLRVNALGQFNPGSVSTTIVTVNSDGTIVNNNATGGGTPINSSGVAAALVFASGSNYNHITTTTLSMPAASWNVNSNANFSSVASVSNMTQTFGNVTISAAGTVTANGTSPTIAGTLTINTSSVFSISSNTLTFLDNGNLSATGTGTITITGNLSFTGTGGSAGTIRLTNNPTTLINLTMNRNGGSATFTVPVNVGTVLAMSNGIINMGSNLLAATSGVIGAVTNSGGVNSYVNGALQRSFNSGLSGVSVIFPVGKSACQTLTYNNFYTHATGGVIRVEAFDANSSGTFDPSLSALNTDNYWSVQVTSQNSISTFGTVTLSESGLTNGTHAIGVTTSSSSGRYYSLGGSVSGATITSSILTPNATSTGNYYYTIGTGVFNALCGSGAYTIGHSTGDFKSITEAVNSLNVRGVSCAVTFELLPEYDGSTNEVYPINIYYAGTASNTVTFRPKSTNSSARTTAGDPGTGYAAIVLNGAQYITFDGRIGGSGSTVSWIVRNSRTSSTVGPAIELTNGANNNTLKYVQFESQNVSQTTTTAFLLPGTVCIYSASYGPGNNNITIQNCNIAPYSTTYPAYGIVAYGYGTAYPNSTVSVLNNNIYNFIPTGAGTALTSGILVSGTSTTGNYGDNWTISGNSLYNNVTQVQSGYVYPINFQPGNNSTSNNVISGNYIGGQSANAGGTGSPWNCISISSGGTTSPAFAGIYVQSGAATVTGNIVTNIQLNNSNNNGSFYGINIASGGTGAFAVNGNTIGNPSPSGSAVGLSYPGTGANGSAMIGIINQAAGLLTIGATGSGNGNTISNLIHTRTSTNSQVGGIVSIAGTTNSIANNTISNLTGAALITSSFQVSFEGSVAGISVSSTTAGQININKNTIYNLTNTNATATANRIFGIRSSIASTGPHNCDGNLIYGLASPNGNTAQILVGIGLESTSSSSAVDYYVTNNMIDLGTRVDASSITGSANIIGIYDNLAGNATNTIRVLHNSVYIGGTGVTGGAVNTMCFYRNTTSIRNIEKVYNNIFVNNRSLTSGTGFNYGIAFETNATVSTDYNIVYGTGTGYKFGLITSTGYTTKATWVAANAAFDVNSIEGDPKFENPTAGTPDLHIQASPVFTYAEGTGTASFTVASDFDGDTRSSSSPVDIGADAGGFAGPPIISYTPLAGTTSTSSRTFTPVSITSTAFGINTTTGTAPRCYYRKSTNSNAINDNTSGTDGWKYAEPDGGGTTSPFSFSIDYSKLNGAAPTLGTIIQYFVVAQDNAGTPHIAINMGSFASAPSSVALATANLPTGVNSYTIFSGVNAAYYVGPSSCSGNGATHTTLTTASTGFFAAVMNQCNGTTNVVNQNITVYITGNITEPGTVALNQWVEDGNGPYYLNIVPCDASLKTLTTSAALPVITLSGADRVVIDGRFNKSGTTSYLTLASTNTGSAASAITFNNDAQYDSVKYCTLTGRNNTNGVVQFLAAASGGSGNSYNVIDNNAIGSNLAGNLDQGIVSSNSTAGTYNHDNTISNNRITDGLERGISITSTGSGSNWTISGNSIYNTAANANLQIYIQFTPGTSSINNTISGNYLGGTAVNCGGSAASLSLSTAVNEGMRIDVSSDAANPTVISGNTITNITAAGAFYGININNSGGSSAVDILNNTVGSGTTASVVQGNAAGGGVEGIVTSSTGTVNIIGNTIGGLFANGTSSIAYGIFQTTGTANILNNTIVNIYHAAVNASSHCRGIYATLTGTGNVIAGNTVRRMGNSATSGAYTSNEANGIQVTLTTGNTGSIYNNRCTEFFQTTLNAGLVFGIKIGGAGSWNVYNNMVNIHNKSFVPAVYTVRRKVMGIYDNTTGGTNNYYYNSVLIQGDAAVNLSGTTDYHSYCFLKLPASGNGATVTVKNNILINNFKTISETTTYSQNYAIGTTVSAGFTSDYNFLSTQMVTGFPVGKYVSTDAMTLTDWRSTSGQDANSFIGSGNGITALATSGLPETPTGNTTNGTVNPYDLFVDAAGGDLHVTLTPSTSPSYYPFNYVAAQGTDGSSITALDYDTTSRGSNPCIGADEFVSNPTFTVSGAGSGATYGNGTTTETLNSSITATAGTISGKNCVGWTGTGSVSATGTSNSVMFTITQNSAITWLFANDDIPSLTAKSNGSTGPVQECSGNVIALSANPVAPSPNNCSGTPEYSWYNGSQYWGGSSFNSGSPVFDAAYENISPTISANTTYTVTVWCSTNHSSTGTSSVTVNVIGTSPSNLAAVIGSPANGTNHHMTVTWTNASGATGGYDLQRSIDGGSYSTIASGTASNTNYDDAAGDYPNAAISYKIKVHTASGNCSYVTLATPKYTACDVPAAPTITGAQPTTLNVAVTAESPVPNSASTLYSIFTTNGSQYVQSDGTLGGGEVYQTAAAWGTITVTGLSPNTSYCFYAKAKNGDGDVRSGAANQACATTCTPPVVSITPDPVSICAGSGTGLTASGANTYVWSPSTGLSSTTGASVTASPTVTTTYTVAGTTSGACSSTASVTVTVNPLPTVTAISSGNNICTGDNITLTAGGASTYSWSPSTYLSATTGTPVTSTPASTGSITYTVTGTDGNSCQNTATVSLTAYDRPTPISGTVTVGSGGTYETFNGAGGLFDAINTNGITGTLTVQVISDITEIASTPLTTVVACGGGSVLIQPDGSTLRTISGNVSPALLTFSGASYVTIDGRSGGSGQYLKFAVNNSSSSDIVFQNSANNITVEYCILDIQSSGNSGSLVKFSTSSSGTTGNSYITIDHNLIGSSNWIANNIYSLGTGGTTNKNNTITNNDIYNFRGTSNARGTGINITSTGNGGNWTISGNSLYSTAVNSQGPQTAIDFSAGSSSNNNVISGNYIGGSATGATACGSCGVNYMGSTYSPTSTEITHIGINVNAGTTNNYVTGNTIKRIYINAPYYSGYIGINTAGSTAVTVNKNIFGGTYPADFITSPANSDMIEVNGGAGTTYPGYIYGIWSQESGTFTADSNTFNYMVQNGSQAGGNVQCIVHQGTGTAIITNNDNTAYHQEAFGIDWNCYGIRIAPTGSTSGNRIENNKIGCVMITGALTSQVSTDGIMVDILPGLTVSGTIKNNRIFDNSTVENSGVIEGIYINTSNGNSSSNGNWDIYNNMIHLSNVGQTLIRTEIDGIDVNVNSGSTTNIYYNTVWIEGTNRNNTSTLANPSSCLLIIPGASGSSGTMNVKNNVLLNTRVGGSPNSDTYHVALWHSSGSASGWTSDYNIYHAKYVSPSSFQYGRMAVWGTNSMFNLVTLQGYDGGDAHSYRPNLDFTGTTSSFSGNNLYEPGLFNLTTSTADLSVNLTDGQSYQFLNNRGTPVSVTSDYQGDTRDGSTPDLGADEFTPCSAGASISSQTNVTCNGGSNGSATVNPTGSSPFLYSWAPGGGTDATASGLSAQTYTVTVTATGGCNATATVTITQPSVITGSQTTSACDSYAWNGTTYTSGGDKTHLFAGGSAAGCDSTATLHLTIKSSTSGSESQTACDSYTWNGATYTTGGDKTYLFAGGNTAGCDSTATLHLTINNSSEASGEESATACGSYIWNGATYTTGGDKTYLFAGGNAVGCDSTATLHLTINGNASGNESQTACDSYAWNGTTYTTGGDKTYSFAGAADNGCDSIATLHLTINSSNSGSESQTACDSYAWNGSTYTTGGDKTHLFAGGNAVGCDSTATLHLTINLSSSGSESQTACDSYAWNGSTYTTGGDKTHLFAGGNAAGCDSTATLHLTINLSSTGSESQTACDSYAWNGTTYTSGGDKTRLFTAGNAVGCDSTATLHLTINSSSAGSESQTACDSYVWNGSTYTSGGDKTHLFAGANAAGCDSTATLHLTINLSSSGSESQTACDSYAWNGSTYTTGGDKTHLFAGGNAVGCDSTATLHLTINLSSAGNESQTACDSYAWNGSTYTTGGDKTHLFAGGNAVGCDSTATLHLTINLSSSGSESQTACDSYAWNGSTYTTGGDKTHLFTGGNAAGCDSAATLRLTINLSSSGSESQTACNSYAWNGSTYTTGGDKTHLFAGGNAAGCDSIATLHLTINLSSAGSESQTACDSYAWNGSTYTTGGDKTHLFTGGNAAGCDSTATLHLTINLSSSGSESQTACDSYAWNGSTYTTGGDKTHLFAGGNAAGCDSTTTLHLTINASSSGSESQTACDSYVWNGATYTIGGDKTHLFAGGNAAGCDSAATLHLTINSSTAGEESVTACESYIWNSSTYTTGGDKTHLFAGGNAAGCDSTATLHLTINQCNYNYTVTLFLQGYYLGGGHMSPLLHLLGAAGSSDVDTVTVELHDANDPYSALYSSTGVLSSDGNLVCSFPNGSAGDYYIVVKHRNSVETWSAEPQTVGTDGSYNFTGDADQAFGSGSMADLGGGVYGIYSGDIDRDGNIDAADQTALQGELPSFLVGVYDANDLTGDGFVDEDDLRILQNNIPLTIGTQKP